jgi:hypothetical protein
VTGRSDIGDALAGNAQGDRRQYDAAIARFCHCPSMACAVGVEAALAGSIAGVDGGVGAVAPTEALEKKVGP